jgi:hypothetical protein
MRSEPFAIVGHAYTSACLSSRCEGLPGRDPEMTSRPSRWIWSKRTPKRSSRPYSRTGPSIRKSGDLAVVLPRSSRWYRPGAVSFENPRV